MVAAAALACGAVLGAAQANAAVLFDFPHVSPVEPSPGFLDTVEFQSAGGAGEADFTIDGFRTLDGANNCCTDTFTLSLNGVAILSGAWDLGGGGDNVVFFAPVGATFAPSTPGFGKGGQVIVTTPLTLAAGANSLRFAFDGADQGLDDESWAVQDVLVTGPAVTAGAVPEPTSWALMLAGFLGLGGALRSRRSAGAAT
jgi:hypothetical protein